MTYVTLLENLANASDIEAAWQTAVKKNGRKKAGRSIVSFMEQHGQLMYPGDSDPAKIYYRFPSLCLRTDIAGLRRLYSFFFYPARVEVITKYEG